MPSDFGTYAMFDAAFVVKAEQGKQKMSIFC